MSSLNSTYQRPAGYSRALLSLKLRSPNTTSSPSLPQAAYVSGVLPVDSQHPTSSPTLCLMCVLKNQVHMRRDCQHLRLLVPSFPRTQHIARIHHSPHLPMCVSTSTLHYGFARDRAPGASSPSRLMRHLPPTLRLLLHSLRVYSDSNCTMPAHHAPVQIESVKVNTHTLDRGRQTHVRMGTIEHMRKRIYATLALTIPPALPDPLYDLLFSTSDP